MNRKEKAIGKLPDGKEVRLAAQDKVKNYQGELREILEIIGYPGALITDLSCTGDFFATEDDEKSILREIGERLGIKTPKQNEYLVDIARRAWMQRNGS